MPLIGQLSRTRLGGGPTREAIIAWQRFEPPGNHLAYSRHATPSPAPFLASTHRIERRTLHTGRSRHYNVAPVIRAENLGRIKHAPLRVYMDIRKHSSYAGDGCDTRTSGNAAPRS